MHLLKTQPTALRVRTVRCCAALPVVVHLHTRTDFTNICTQWSVLICVQICGVCAQTGPHATRRERWHTNISPPRMSRGTPTEQG